MNRRIINSLIPILSYVTSKSLPYAWTRCSNVYLQHPAIEASNTSLKNFIPQKFTCYSTDCSATEVDCKQLRQEGVCWNCRKKLDDLTKFFCSLCGSVIPMRRTEDYFSLFGIDRNFKLCLSQLQKEFKKLQGQLHPDKFSMKSLVEQEISEDISSELNKAYFTLLKPLSRGIYMLELQGVFMTEDVTADDPDFLMEIMELNERVAEAETMDALKAVRQEVVDYVETLTNKIADEFQSGNISRAKAAIISFKYYDNILVKLKEKIPPT